MRRPTKDFATAALAAMVLAACGGSSRAPRREAARDDYLPTALAPVVVGVDLGGALERGCFAWSAREHRVACVVGEQSMQEGGHYEVAFVPTDADSDAIEIVRWEPAAPEPTLVLSPDARYRVEARLRQGAYEPLGGDAVSLEPGQDAAVPATSVRVAWRRQTLDHIETEVGAWDVVRDTVVLVAPSGHESIVATEELEAVSGVPARVRVLPDGRRVLVEVSSIWALEGDSGRGLAAYVAPLP